MKTGILFYKNSHN